MAAGCHQWLLMQELTHLEAGMHVLVTGALPEVWWLWHIPSVGTVVTRESLVVTV